MICPHCNAELADGSYYCRHCRSNIPADVVKALSGATPEAAAQTVAAWKQPTHYCPHCGTWGKPKTVTRGSFFIELVLWLCFLVPGLIYSIWRLSSRQAVCPACKTPHMLPASSPVAQAAKAV